MRYGKFLEQGGTIGFVAPSFGCNIEPYKSAFNNAQKIFEKRGYKLSLGPNCYEGKGIGISNTPEKCGEELTHFYCEDSNDVLMSCGGGELMCEILEYVDFDKIRNAPPKWYMGYSDNTNMTFLLTTLCDTASIYGPCAPAFGMEVWHPAIEDAFGIISGAKKDADVLVVSNYDKWEKESLKDEESPLMPYNVTEPTIVKKFVPGIDWDNETLQYISYTGKSASIDKVDENILSDNVSEVNMSGRMLGGCMDCLVNLTGTKYDRVNDFCNKYKDEGIIWFLESCDLNVMAIRRAIWQMENAGWFDTVKGFIIGRPLVFGQEMLGLNQYSAVCDLLKKHNVPIIMDADIGHLAPMMPLVCGSLAKVTTAGNNLSGNSLKISMNCV